VPGCLATVPAAPTRSHPRGPPATKGANDDDHPTDAPRACRKYLGNLNANSYDPNSVSNPYGRYGSPYSPDSINNPYGQYGSPYSPNSVTNPYATGPDTPRVIAPGAGNGR
jgi:hypothetical protein